MYRKKDKQLYLLRDGGGGGGGGGVGGGGSPRKFGELATQVLRHKLSHLLFW